MRACVVIAVAIAAVGLSACGQQSSSANAQAAGAVIENHSDFITRCTRETIASNPESQNWARSNCEQAWEIVVAAGPMAEAILAAVPTPGEVVAGASVPARVTNVTWRGRPEGAVLAQGQLGDAAVQVEAAALNFSWQMMGEMIPFDVVEALRGRGANVTMIGCMMLGVGEANKTYRVEAPGRAPFALGIYDRTAPTASANSFYNVSVDLSGAIPTLSQMRANGDDVGEACPY